MAIALSLAASVGYGVSDFIAGGMARRVPAVLLALWSQVASGVVLLVLVLALGQLPGAAALGWGVAVGVVGALGTLVFYRALATGPTSIVAPVAASGVLIPVVVDLLRGEVPSTRHVCLQDSAVSGSQRAHGAKIIGRKYFLAWRTGTKRPQIAPRIVLDSIADAAFPLENALIRPISASTWTAKGPPTEYGRAFASWHRDRARVYCRADRDLGASLGRNERSGADDDAAERAQAA